MKKPEWLAEAVQRDIDQTGHALLKQPEDLDRYAKIIEYEQIERVIETGTWKGESARWFAARVPWVITIDNVDRSLTLPENVTKIVFDAVDAAIDRVGPPGPRTLVSLDDAHDAHHVYAELEKYAPLVSIGSYIVVEDTIHHWRKEFRGDDPLVAVRFWMAGREDFEVAPDYGLTMNPGGWLRRVK